MFISISELETSKMIDFKNVLHVWFSDLLPNVDQITRLVICRLPPTKLCIRQNSWPPQIKSADTPPPIFILYYVSVPLPPDFLLGERQRNPK